MIEEDLLEGEDRAQKCASVDAVGVPVDYEDDADADKLAEYRQESFEAGTFYWQSERLEPFSSARDALFIRLRKRLTAYSLQECFEDPGLFVQDAQLIVWLCLTPYQNLVLMLRDPDALMLDFMNWCEKNVTRAQAAQITNLGMEIFNDAAANTSEPKPSEDPIDDGELGN